MSLWRFNVGAGSAEQGEASQIASPWMRTECFLQADGNYNWNKQQGQRNFLRLAKERGVNKFLAFLNSPPVYFTQNGLATNTGRGGTLNLKEEHYKNFARFLARRRKLRCPCCLFQCHKRGGETRWNQVQLPLSIQ